MNKKLVMNFNEFLKRQHGRDCGIGEVGKLMLHEIRFLDINDLYSKFPDHTKSINEAYKEFNEYKIKRNKYHEKLSKIHGQFKNFLVKYSKENPVYDEIDSLIYNRLTQLETDIYTVQTYILRGESTNGGN